MVQLSAVIRKPEELPRSSNTQAFYCWEVSLFIRSLGRKNLRAHPQVEYGV